MDAAAVATVEDLEIMVGDSVLSTGEYGSWAREDAKEGLTLSDSRLEAKGLLLRVGLSGAGCCCCCCRCCCGGWGHVDEKDLCRMVVPYSLCGERIGGVIGDVVRKLE